MMLNQTAQLRNNSLWMFKCIMYLKCKIAQMHDKMHGEARFLFTIIERAFALILK